MNNKKPIIGISSSVLIDSGGIFPGYERAYVNKDYVDAVVSNGAIPIIIPFTTDKEIIKEQMELVDALLLTGGHDVWPLNYGQEPLPKLQEVFPQRDEYDFELFRIAREKDIPVLGICRGFQIMNVYDGGTLFQDLSYVGRPTLKHMQGHTSNLTTHSVTVTNDSKLYDIFNREEFLVNSFHHQVLDKVACNYNIVAKAKDDIVEAIEDKNSRFVVGVQWHPEMLFKTDSLMNKLFERFIKEASK